MLQFNGINRELVNAFYIFKVLAGGDLSATPWGKVRVLLAPLADGMVVNVEGANSTRSRVRQLIEAEN